MWFISADGLTSCRGSMPHMWEGLIRRFIFEVRLSGSFECVFCRYFRLIIGIWEWRHDLQIANMLLLRNPRGTCACGQKNDWLCIGHHLGFLWGPRPHPLLVLLLFCLLLLRCFIHSSLLVLFVGKKDRTRSRQRRQDQDQDQDQEGKHLNHIWKQERG